MWSSGHLLISSIFISLFLMQAHSYVEFTNIVCKSLDKKFTEFTYCYLKSVNRSYKYFSLRAKLLQLPITDLWINYAVFKRANGYKPFLYNITVDACAFLKSRNNPVSIFIHDFVRKYSNFNHTCPLNHDLIFEKLDTTFFADKLSLLPFPSGQYAFNSKWFVFNVLRADFWLYFKVEDYKNV